MAQRVIFARFRHKNLLAQINQARIVNLLKLEKEGLKHRVATAGSGYYPLPCPAGTNLISQA
jgi:hypothetical protein